MLSRPLCLLCCLLFTAFATAQSVPRSSHVWMITEENHSFEEVVGNPQMPYFNQLIQQYGLATQFYSDQHSSLPALMWLVAGAPVELDNDTVSCGHPDDNVVRELLNRGYTWRSYQEDLPYAGFQGLYGPDYLYYRRHNPLIDFTDVCPGTGQDTNSVPLAQMARDFSQIGAVNFAYLTPGVNDDGHDGTLEAADQWLQWNVPQILARPEFSPGGEGILFVVWDEGNLTDDRCSATVWDGCGGRTATLVIGPQIVSGYQSTIFYRNENVLKTFCAVMGLSPCPGAADAAAPMADFFVNNTGSAGGSHGILISAPGNGATVVGAVHLIATAYEGQPVSQTQVWDNGVKLSWYGNQIDAAYNLTPGVHTTSVFDLDSSYSVINESSVTYEVQPLINAVQIVAPSPNETIIMSTVHLVAQANESVPITQMQVWDNGVKLGWYPGAYVDQFFNLAPGPHTVTVLDLDSNYSIIHLSSVSYSVQ